MGALDPPSTEPPLRPRRPPSEPIPPLPSRPALLALIGLLVALGPTGVQAAPRPPPPSSPGSSTSLKPAADDGQSSEPRIGRAGDEDRTARQGVSEGRRMARRPSRGNGRRAALPLSTSSIHTSSSSPTAWPSSSTLASSSGASQQSFVASRTTTSSALVTNSPTTAVRAAHAFGVAPSRKLVDKYEEREEGWALDNEWELYGFKLAVVSSDASPSATEAAFVSTSSTSATASPTTLPPGWGGGSRDEFEVPLIVVISVGLTCIVLATIFTFLARRNKQRRIARRQKRHEEKKLRRANEAAEAALRLASPIHSSPSTGPGEPGAGGPGTLQIPRVNTQRSGDALSIVSSATSSSVASRNGSARRRSGKARVVGTLRSAGRGFLRISKGKGKARDDSPVEDEVDDEDGQASGVGMVRTTDDGLRTSTYEPTSPGVVVVDPSSASSSQQPPALSSRILITDTDGAPAPPPPHPSHSQHANPTPPAYQHAASSSTSANGFLGPPRLARSRPSTGSTLTDVHSDDSQSEAGADEDANDDDQPPPPHSSLQPQAGSLPAIPTFRDEKRALRPASPPPGPSSTDAPSSGEAVSQVMARYAHHLATDDKAVLARLAREASAPAGEEQEGGRGEEEEGSAPPIWEATDSNALHGQAAHSTSSPSNPDVPEASQTGSTTTTTVPQATSLPAPPRAWGTKTLEDPYLALTAREAAVVDPIPSPIYVPSEPTYPPSLAGEPSAPSFPPADADADDEEDEGAGPSAPPLAQVEDDEHAFDPSAPSLV